MLYKNAFAKIKKSWGRYLSLVAIVMIGVGFYAGVYATAPAISGVAEEYFSEHRLMDYKIAGTMGLTDDDAKALASLEGVNSAIASYSLDVHSSGGVIRVHAIEEMVNTSKLTVGRMPKSDGECLADRKEYNVGDTIEITGDYARMLKNTEYIVVGLIESVLYLYDDYGSTTAGNGALESFAFIPRDNFMLPVYTEIYIITDADGTEPSFSDVSQPNWYISDRSAAAGYDVLNNSIQVVTVVSSVLPFFFILIVMLMTSNSMTRMIAEERSELGTMTSLGFGDGKIILTYVLYVLSAAWLGAVSGFFIGCRFIPPLIYSNFTDRLPPLETTYSIAGLTLMLAVATILMTIVTVFACRRELRQKPASLLRPLPPKRGRRIILERIDPLWRRLSFTWKVTARNMLRYKKRAIMTIIGISGCTALLVTGFGLRDGMSGVAARQYGEIFRYDVMLILRDETESLNDALAELFERHGIIQPLLINHSAYECENNGEALDSYMIVPQDDALFEHYFSLNTARNGKLDDIVITQRLARVLAVGKGDSVTISDPDNNSREITISGVTENYTSNYIYVTPEIYTETFGAQPVYNAVVAGFSGDESALGEELSDSGLILSSVFTSDARESIHESTQNLNGVIVLIIVVAAMLAVVVLYNLTAINISERTREIATLKVLGFRDGETNAYIYREAIVLTVLSIAVGFFLGIAMHRYISGVIEESVLSLTLKIKPVSYMLSGLIIIAVSFLMQLITYTKLKKLDMLKALKSVE